MAATIVGSPSPTASATNAKVLRRQQYQKDMNGLETLVETYTIQSQNLLSIIPEKDTKHTAFSTATSKYARMAVETISTSELDGGLTELSVTFVGLTSSSGLPPAIIRIVPVTGAGIFGPPMNIEAEFLSDSNENDFLKGKLSSASPIIENGRYNQKRMPRFINGVATPQNPREPYFKSNTGGFALAGSALKVTTFTDAYEGYCINSTQFVRRGEFLVANINFQEFRFFYVSQ